MSELSYLLKGKTRIIATEILWLQRQSKCIVSCPLYNKRATLRWILVTSKSSNGTQHEPDKTVKC
ncbi:hypothetical protein WG68_05065 [Arsukibacterium ikkense]|uniref:Uncharacterized protein n=1 Tax=Arsukibacterium ikkense TaxID=336831 RepID=A0A0M2V7T2_9GAMM|nr:hypothetical protein WG68_05065 [Arsukibacterium ikkense]